MVAQITIQFIVFEIVYSPNILE